MLQRQLTSLTQAGDRFNRATRLLYLGRADPRCIDRYAETQGVAEILLTAQPADRRC